MPCAPVAVRRHPEANLETLDAIKPPQPRQHARNPRPDPAVGSLARKRRWGRPSTSCRVPANRSTRSSMTSRFCEAIRRAGGRRPGGQRQRAWCRHGRLDHGARGRTWRGDRRRPGGAAIGAASRRGSLAPGSAPRRVRARSIRSSSSTTTPTRSACMQQGQHGAGLRADDDATAAWWSAPAAGLTVSGRRGTQPRPEWIGGSGELAPDMRAAPLARAVESAYLSSVPQRSEARPGSHHKIPGRQAAASASNRTASPI